MKVTLPQANDLGKVVEVMTYIHYHPGAGFQEIAEYMGFTTRQAQYYVGACLYLNLADNKNHPTEVCEMIFKNCGPNVAEGVYEQIITDSLVGKIFARALLRPDSDLHAYALELASMEFPKIESEATLERRSHCLILWVKKIINYIKLKNSI